MYQRELPPPDPNWDWSAEKKRRWEVASDEWPKFYQHWRNSSTSSKLLNTFPYILEQGVEQGDMPLLPFHGGDTSQNRILVTES